MPGGQERLKRFVGSVYSAIADTVYDRVVVGIAFPLFGGDLHALVREQQRAAVRAAGGGPILDLPVGTAYFTVEMAEEHDGLVVGADIAFGMVRETARRGPPNLMAVQADAHHLPWHDGAFACVVSSNGLQVMPGLRPTLAEFYRVLAPGGRLLASTITVPLGAAVSEKMSRSLPVILRSGRDLAGELEHAGFSVDSCEQHRLAVILQATKPAPTI